MRCARLDPSWLAALLAFLSLAAAPCCAAGSGDDQPPPQPAAGAGLAAKEEEVRSSYKSNVTFGEVIGAVCFALAPRRIAEFGVLDGFSLRALSASSPPDAAILAVDLFDGFTGNHAHEDRIRRDFSGDAKVTVQRGNFWDAPGTLRSFPGGSGGGFDLIHVDVANTADEFEFAATHLAPLLSPGGVLVMEGGSAERDAVPWMAK